MASPSQEETLFNPKSYWEQRLGNHPSLQEVGFSLLGSQYNQWLYRMRRMVFRRLLLRPELAVRDCSVLDIGSGTGFYVDLWQKSQVASVIGSDLTNTSVDYLRSRFPDITIYALDIGEELPAEMPTGLDVISAFDVLFHIIDDDRFVRAIGNISKLLKLGGIFVFSDLFLHKGTKRSTHYVTRELSDVQTVLAEAGFETILRRPVFVVMNEPQDTRCRLWQFCWRVAMYPVKRSELVGAIMGASLFTIDSVLTRSRSESPTTEVMVCRKIR